MCARQCSQSSERTIAKLKIGFYCPGDVLGMLRALKPMALRDFRNITGLERVKKIQPCILSPSLLSGCYEQINR